MWDEFELNMREPLEDEEEETSIPAVFSDDEEVIDPELDSEDEEDEAPVDGGLDPEELDM